MTNWIVVTGRYFESFVPASSLLQAANNPDQNQLLGPPTLFAAAPSVCVAALTRLVGSCVSVKLGAWASVVVVG